MIQQREKSFLRVSRKHFLIVFASTGMLTQIHAQQLPLTDLSYFDKPAASWQIAGDVHADLDKQNLLTSSAGTGILVNLPTEKTHGQDLLSLIQHGDADLEFDFMMAKGSNSGVYLQGRYEIQLLDSWNINRPGYGDNGGIYERWDDARGKGNEGYQGYAPRQNVSMAPGLWQHLKIVFQAPRFNAAGLKTANARMLKIELNGVTIHENVELLGATRGSMGQEVPLGPLRIQGDHGAVAFRNLRLVNYSQPRPVLSNLKYAFYKGKFDVNPDYKKMTAANSGFSEMLTSNIDTKKADAYLVRYTGNISIKEAGDYNFRLFVPEGAGALKIDGNVVGKAGGDRINGTITLPAGDHAIELQYAKTEDWAKPSLAFYVGGPGIREYLVSDPNTVMSDLTDPIIADGITTPVLRSFMDLKGFGRLTHAVSVSSPQKVHYTYDMDRGNIVQVWRGGFLDATPMWHDRGDGSSRPLGATRLLGLPSFSIDQLATTAQAWRLDSAGTNYRPTGYTLDATDRPIFNYQLFGAKVSDAIHVLEMGQGFERVITVENAPGQLYLRLAKAALIENLGNGLYLVNDKSYYLRIANDAGNVIIRDADGGKELIVPIQNKLVYAIIF
ncbi:MAG: family 16 glycoside hydrolase [Bacteroidota bacterium]